MGIRMQKIWTLVFVGLALFLPLKGYGALIWESLEAGTPRNYSKMNAIGVYATLPQDQKALFSQLFGKLVGKNGKIEVIQDLPSGAYKLLGAPLQLHLSFAVTDDPNISLLRVYTAASSEILLNGERYSGTIWEKSYLFKGRDQLQADLSAALEESVKLFLSQYFSTNPSAKGVALFYFFNN